MALITCIECNHQISDAARSCPVCSTTEPLGTACELCYRRMRRSEGVTCKREHYSDGVVSVEYVAHKDCVDHHFTIPATFGCPDCGLRLGEIGTDITPLTLWSAWKHINCPGCGATDLLVSTERRLQRCPQLGCFAPFYVFQIVPLGRGHGHPGTDRSLRGWMRLWRS